MTLAQEAIGGLSAGIIGTVIGFPFDTIKARQQVLGTSMRATSSSIFRQEGVWAFYRGLVPPLLSLSILNTLNFTSYSYFQRQYQARRGWDIRNLLAGASCGPLASTVSTVENLIKTKLQLDKIHEYRGSWDCLTKLVRLHGIQVVYTGHAVNTVRETMFLASYFGIYEGLREILFHYRDVNHLLAIPAAGGVAGALAWTISFPLDCVRAGVQGRDLMVRTNARQVFLMLMKDRGVRGLYSGVTPSIVRAFLVSGSRFTAYEAALWILRGGRDAREG